MRSVFAAAAAALLIVVPGAQAQRTDHRPANWVPQTLGLSLGANPMIATGLTIAGPGMRGELKTNMGEGAGVQVACGFTPQFTVFASAGVAKQATDMDGFDGSTGLAHLEVGGRMNFPQPGKRTVPASRRSTASAAWGRAPPAAGCPRPCISPVPSRARAGAGGILYALSPVLSLDAGVIGSRGKFTNITVTGDVHSDGPIDVDNTTSLRLKVGFLWHP